ncbi:hypothetical protein, partial [Pseudomonas gingeri]|uniref:hypothetical protein n=1 Tax=Pseudomonas gingeri TaxID=117681 RepID=UPI0015A01B51
SLKVTDGPGLASKALASGGLIGPGDNFEHLLVVTDDQFSHHMYHFIVGAPLKADGPRRTMLVSTKTLHGAFNVPGDKGADMHALNRGFATKLLSYATALGSPRLIVENAFLDQLLRQMSHPHAWIYAPLGGGWHVDGEDDEYENLGSFGYVLYTGALRAKAIVAPAVDHLTKQTKDGRLVTSERGRIEFVDILKNMHRDLAAMALVFLEGEAARNAVPVAYSRSAPAISTQKVA